MEVLEQTTRPRYCTRLQTRKMKKESDARIERLEKAHQDHQGQMTEMMELLRTLVKEKGRHQARTYRMRQPNLAKEGKSLYTLRGSRPHMLRMSTWHNHHQCNKPEVSRMTMCLP